MKFKVSNALFLVLFFCTGLAQAAADIRYKPYCLVEVEASEVVSKLTAAGFEVVGEYEPAYEGKPSVKAKIIVVTSKTLKDTAALSTKGGYGAIMRVAITDGQVSYTNPPYWANMYRMATDLTDVATALEGALGKCKEFGSKKGMTKEDLREYHYAPFMPYFDDPVELATHKTYEKAVKTVKTNLEAGKGKTQFVYCVEVSGKKETVCGMGILGDHDGADKKIMPILNGFTDKPLHTAYMPYEVLITGTNVEMLHGKFRIAISFPDLKLLQFMEIRGAPDSIEEAAKAVAGAK